MQLEVNEYVDRSRRINLNDLESIPGLVVAGFLLVLTDPPLLLAQILIWIYVASRAAHFVAYVTAQLHDIRAFCWTWGSLSVIVMAAYVLVKAPQDGRIVAACCAMSLGSAAVKIDDFRGAAHGP